MGETKLSSNVDINIRYVDGIELVPFCDHDEGRKSFELFFVTLDPWTNIPEMHRFSITANRSAVAKFERIAAAVSAIMAEPDAGAPIETAE